MLEFVSKFKDGGQGQDEIYQIGMKLSRFIKARHHPQSHGRDQLASAASQASNNRFLSVPQR